ncbi:hypothetical protein [Nocardioides pelophilus]|uniref:hypothetical protein n=1 Tax=Nocardioides pelophilus TaxID=2172019 RepID=UPI0015FFF619|nr:hypothetical protein [Nocardioides pelophilus]
MDKVQKQQRLRRSARRLEQMQQEQLRPQRLGINWKDASVGYNGYVCGPIASTRYDGDIQFINLGRDYPDPARLTIVGWEAAGEVIRSGPPLNMPASAVCAKGTVVSYDGVRQIQMQSFKGRVTPVQ